VNFRLIALALGVALAVSPAFGQVKKETKRATERAELLKSLQRGKSFTIRNETYEFLPEVRALDRGARKQTPQQAIAKLGADGGTYVETKGRYVLYRAPQAKPAAIERADGTAIYPTVLNTRTGVLGVLPGTLVVKPATVEDAAALAAQHGLEIVREFPHLQTVYYRVAAGVDVLDAAAALAADPRVASAHPEVLERVRTPR
jgi:hypothetical protein